MAVQAVLVYVWLTDLSALAGTDTYFSVYLLLGVAALLCLWDNRKGGCLHRLLPLGKQGQGGRSFRGPETNCGRVCGL